MSKVALGQLAYEVRESTKDSSGLPVVGLEHLTPGDVQLSQWSEQADNTFSKVFHKGQVLFGRRRAYQKKAAVAPFDGVCSGDITVIAAKSNRLLPDLLPFIVSSDRFFDYAMEKSAGSLSPRVKWAQLAEFELDIPDSFKEQRQLADLLWAMERSRKAYKALLLQTDELVKSQFVEMFKHIPEDDYVTLQSVCKLITDGTHNPPKFVEKGIPFLLVSNITGNIVTYETDKYITEETYAELMKRTPVEKGDILLSTVGSYGHPAIVQGDQRFSFQRHIAHLKPKHELINSRFLHSAILSIDVQKQIEVLVLGVAQKTLNLSAIKSIRIPLPSIAEQDNFNSFVEQTDKSKYRCYRQENCMKVALQTTTLHNNMVQ